MQLGFDSYRKIPEKKNQQSNTDVTNSSTSSFIADNADILPQLLPNWSKNRTAGCVEYPSEFSAAMVDSSWNTARTLAFLGLVLGGTGTAFLFCSICFVFSKATWRWTGYELLLASLCQTISLSAWFNTQMCSWNTCKFGKGSKADIAAILSWFIGGLMVVCHYPDPDKRSPRRRAIVSDDRRYRHGDSVRDCYDSGNNNNSKNHNYTGVIQSQELVLVGANTKIREGITIEDDDPPLHKTEGCGKITEEVHQQQQQHRHSYNAIDDGKRFPQAVYRRRQLHRHSCKEDNNIEDGRKYSQAEII